MRQNQLDRLAALRLLYRHDLLQLQPLTHSYRLTTYGLDLAARLAEICQLELIPAVQESPLLQGSRATFKPYFADEPDAGGEVCYDLTLPEEEQAFSIAHELGHFILHRGQPTRCEHTDMEGEAAEDTPLEGQVEVYNPKNRREQEANLFALTLLMPGPQLQAEYLELVQAKQAASEPDFTPRLVDRLAHKFRVNPYRLFFQLGNVFLDTPLPLELAFSEAYPEKESAPVDLDEDQAAARSVETPALVLAGPGAGKTRTLVERVRFLVEEKKLNPARLLVLTFSNKAAGELRERLTLAGLAAEEMAISTFHAYGVDLLRRHAERAGLERDFRLLDGAHAYMLLQDILLYLPTGYYVRDENPELYLSELLTDIGRAKDYLRTPADYDAAVEQMAAAPDSQGSARFKPEDVEKARNRAEVYRVYEEQKKLRKQVDFGDLVMLPVRLMRQDNQVLNEERSRYEQILVDEFQDINYASGELLRLLAAPALGGKGNIWAVGDINQSIYRFRGAFPRQAGTEAFKQDYAGPQPVNALELSLNYRSLPPVVSLANYLRAAMPENGIQELRSTREIDPAARPDQPGLLYNEFETGAQERATLTAAIQANREAGYSYSDQAILCRTNDEADEIAKTLLEASIPAMRLGEFFNLPQVQEALAVIGMLEDDLIPGLARLGRGKLDLLQFLELARSAGLTPRQALRSPAVSAQLEAPARQSLIQITTLLDTLSNRSSLGRLLAEYLFEWSDTVAELHRQAAENNLTARQALLALGQLIRLGAAFDREEQDRTLRQEERRLGRKLNREEREVLLRRKIRAGQQRHNFLRYKNALVQSGTRVELESLSPGREAGQPGAVQIITVHKSKGLEFPCVYLPGLHRRQAQHDVLEPAPPGFHLKEPGAPENDAACLFYVGVTRARDKIMLSWARREEAAALMPAAGEEETAPKTARARSAGVVLRPVLEHRQANPALWSSLDPIEPPEPLPRPASTVPLIAAEAGKDSPITEITYFALKDYLRCPSRYYYKHKLKGQASRDENKTRFYEGLRQAQQTLSQSRLTGTDLPGLETILQQYHALWQPAGSTGEEAGPIKESELALEPGEPLEITAADYQRQRGAAIVEQIWQHYQARPAPATAQPVGIEYNRTCRVTLNKSVITFRVDRVETMPDGSLRLVRSLVRRPFQAEDELSTDDWYLPTLYALAFPTQPNCPANQIVLETTNKQGVQQLGLPKAYKKAGDYRRWQRGEIKAVGLLGKLDRGLQSLAAGDFSPKPDRHCVNCPFYTVICPLMPA
jgi:superfamily I DNA/RNA helicase